MYMRELTHQVVTGTDQAVVQTDVGAVRGAIVEGSYIFKGIPYAEAKRFQMPRPMDAWSGIRQALCFGSSAPELNTPIAEDSELVPRYYFPQSESCLTLNIWTQNISSMVRRPVIITLYGNDWSSGSSNELWASDGENLSALGNVVVVSVNHRLGALGFLDLSDFDEKYRCSSNLGLLDLIEALQWIHRNIEAFGGDPNCVTLMGLSGGADKVIALMQCPTAEGLFHRVSLQGSGLSPLNQTAENGKEIAKLTLQELNIEQDRVYEIETVALYDLHSAVLRAVHHWEEKHKQEIFSFGPMADGKIYLGHQLVYGFSQQSLKIPMLIGSTFSEYQRNRLCMENVGIIQKSFSMIYPNKSIDDLFFLDTSIRPNLLNFIKKRVEVNSAPIYLWLFTLESPWNGKTTAWHNADVPYMLNNAQYIESAFLPNVSDELQKKMAGSLLHFAQYGNPNYEKIPNWSYVNDDCVPTMHFDQVCTICTVSDKTLLQQVRASINLNERLKVEVVE